MSEPSSSSPKVAILDLGTNTFNLLIAQRKAGLVHNCFKNKIAVKLGQGGIHEGTITKEAFSRGKEAIASHLERVKLEQVNLVKAVATSAIRTANNGVEFTEALRREFGLQVEIIDGLREAELIWKGVRQAVQLNDGPALIMDIGGGSTEFIIADQEHIYWSQSFQLGVARMLDRFKPQDPIQAEELEAIHNFLLEELKPLFEALKRFPCDRLIGSSGSFDSYADMILEKFDGRKPEPEKTEWEFDLEQVKEIYDSLLGMDYAQRLKVPGLIAMRADMIVLSGFLMQFVLNNCGVSKMTRSAYALKEGLLSEMWEN